MKKEVILVPKDRNPMDVLKDLGEQTENAWIFIHDSLRNQPRRFNLCFETYAGTGNVWSRIACIRDWDTMEKLFDSRSDNPENIFFLKMEE